MATYEPIATTTLGSAAGSISFTSIPATYTDLRIILVAKRSTSSTGSIFELRFNSDTNTNYSTTRLYGDGSSATSNQASNSSSGARIWAKTDTTNPVLCEWDIFSYAGSTNKTTLGSGASDLNGSGIISKVVGLWRDTSAITTVSIIATNMAAGTTATLYGILKA